MKIDTPEISWHSRQPMYSLDIQPGNSKVKRLATASTDANVRMWFLKLNKDNKVMPEFMANLSRHTKPVNVVRFSPDGLILASGADDGLCILWRLQDATSGIPSFGKEEEEEDDKETWNAFKTLRGHFEDIYDISWAVDSTRLITGSVDNSAIIWDVKKGDKVHLFKDHRSFVQGVSWDPLNHFCATISCDRSMRIYSLQNYRCISNVSKFSLEVNDNKGESQTKQVRMFHDDSMKSFFRRLAYTPDGQLLIVPSGCIDGGDILSNTTFVFSRLCYTKPILHLPGPSKATVAVRCCPILFKLKELLEEKPVVEEMDTTEQPEKSATKKDDNEVTTTESSEMKTEKKEPNLFDLPYRMVFAVATEDSILIYDTQRSIPFAYVSNIHYTTITDISWSSDGSLLTVCSTDGYVSIIAFNPNEIGEKYEPPKVPTKTLNPEEMAAGEDRPKQNTIKPSQANQISPKEPILNSNGIPALPNQDVVDQQAESLKEHLKVSKPKANIEKENVGKSQVPRRIVTTLLTNDNKTQMDVVPKKVEAPSKTDNTPRRITTTLLSSSAISSTPKGKPAVSSDVQKPSAPANQASNQPRRITLTTIGAPQKD